MNQMARQCCWVATQVNTFTRNVHGPLSHSSHFVARDKSSFFYLSSLATKVFTARSRVVKQSFFSLSGKYDRHVNKAQGVMSRS